MAGSSSSVSVYGSQLRFRRGMIYLLRPGRRFGPGASGDYRREHSELLPGAAEQPGDAEPDDFHRRGGDAGVSHQAILPVLARDVLNVGPLGLGAHCFPGHRRHDRGHGSSSSGSGPKAGCAFAGYPGVLRVGRGPTRAVGHVLDGAGCGYPGQFHGGHYGCPASKPAATERVKRATGPGDGFMDRLASGRPRWGSWN